MPGTPSRRVFGLFNVYRFVLAILIAWVVMEAPHYHVSLSIGWPLVAFLLVYNAILWILWRVVDFVTYGTLLSVIAMALDTLLAALILLQFAFPANTDSPVLLPLLAFEGWAYWNWVGGLLVTMATELLLLGTWFYQKAIGHAAFSPALLVFWAAVLLIIGLVPVSISWVTNEHPLYIAAEARASIPSENRRIGHFDRARTRNLSISQSGKNVAPDCEGLHHRIWHGQNPCTPYLSQTRGFCPRTVALAAKIPRSIPGSLPVPRRLFETTMMKE